MAAEGIQVTVRYRCGAYEAAARGQRASATSGAEGAASRLAVKVFGAGATAEQLRVLAAPGQSVWRLVPGQPVTAPPAVRDVPRRFSPDPCNC